MDGSMMKFSNTLAEYIANINDLGQYVTRFRIKITEMDWGCKQCLKK